jgi:AcrR family transcriptional regulator
MPPSPASGSEPADPDAPKDPPVARRRGRPRSEDRDATILEATTRLLEEIGYDRLRIQDVADRAHVGLATIYRRWPTKQALVIAALEHEKLRRTLPETGNPREVLRAHVHAMVDEFLGPRGSFITGFLTALRTDPDLSDAFRASKLADLRTPLRGAIARILGDDQPDLDLRADLAPAILAFRGLVGDQEHQPDDIVDQLCALILGEPAESSFGSVGGSRSSGEDPA